MARLVVDPGSPAQWEIELKPGINTIGRGFSNDFKLTDVSVSGSHCQVVVEDGTVLLKDLGSTNGTYVNRAPVREAVLQPGQTVMLGRVQMIFDLAPPGSPSLAQVAPVSAAQPAIAAAPAAVAAPVLVARAAPVARLATAIPAPAPIAIAAPPMAPPPTAPVGSGPCKHHPKSPGRYFCNHCRAFFCDLCVTSRMVSQVQHKFCRICGTECAPVQVQMARPPSEKGFFSRLPGVFVYPFKGSGFLVLLVCTIVITALGFISRGLLSIFTKAIFFGYLFAFIQNIIHSTAAEDEELPGWPAWDGLFGGCLRLLGAAVMAFGIPITLYLLTIFSETEIPPSALISTTLLGCFYFPMALLAVAMKDTPLAANPLVVLPAILKAPAEYLVTVILLTGIFGVNLVGGLVAAMLAFATLTTHSMTELFMALGLQLFWSFLKVYLLAVDARLLGVLYLTKKHKLGWFAR